MKKSVAMVLASAFIISGCATASKDVATSYVSPVQYQTYDCAQLSSEAQRIQMKASHLAGQLDTASSHDTAIAWGGGLLFWPALFALGGNDAQEAEYASLKGEHDAVEQTSIAKKCGTQVASN
ncbi:hypothetical protein [Pseudomonas pohangensis]|uniref:hypothetical protein n=1 Tax=Pseudomonas pohangensis TaxID=364197 RepID=UPI0012FE3906|nr:hypothetical protein [Pseudomonas pohangensis]